MTRSIPDAFQSPTSRAVYSVFRSVPLNAPSPTGVVIVNMDVERLRQLVTSTAAARSRRSTWWTAVADPFLEPRAEEVEHAGEDVAVALGAGQAGSMASARNIAR